MSINTTPSSRKKKQPQLNSDKKKEPPSYKIKVCQPNRYDTYLGSKFYYTEIFKDE